MASLNDAKIYLFDLPEYLNEFLDEAHKRALPELLSAIDQFFNIVTSINIQASENHVINPTEATEIGDHGIVLLLQLIDLMDKLDLPHKRRDIEQVSLLFACWTIHYHGSIRHIEPIVNACAQLANLLQSRAELKTLYNLMTQIAASCTDEIKQDLDTNNQFRPWRLLHINRGIVATRTQDPELMRTAFDELLTYLPHEADDFFAQGMREVDAQNCPPHVRNLMEFYHSRKSPGAMH